MQSPAKFYKPPATVYDANYLLKIKSEEPKMQIIKRGSKARAQALATAHNIRLYTLDNSFSAEPVPTISERAIERGELTHGPQGYTLRLHSNCWYNFDAPAPGAPLTERDQERTRAAKYRAELREKCKAMAPFMPEWWTLLQDVVDPECTSVDATFAYRGRSGEQYVIISAGHEDTGRYIKKDQAGRYSIRYFIGESQAPFAPSDQRHNSIKLAMTTTPEKMAQEITAKLIDPAQPQYIAALKERGERMHAACLRYQAAERLIIDSGIVRFDGDLSEGYSAFDTMTLVNTKTSGLTIKADVYDTDVHMEIRPTHEQAAKILRILAEDKAKG
jgi:hypothetical protein